MKGTFDMKKYRNIMIVVIAIMIGITAVNIAFYQTMVQAPIWVTAVVLLVLIASAVMGIYSALMYDKAKKKLMTENGTYSKKKYIISEIWNVSLVVISFHVILIILDTMGIRVPYMELLLKGFLFADIAAVPAAVVTSFMKFKPDDEEQAQN